MFYLRMISVLFLAGWMFDREICEWLVKTFPSCCSVSQIDATTLRYEFQLRLKNPLKKS